MNNQIINKYFVLCLSLCFCSTSWSKSKIDRQAVVKRHNIITTSYSDKSPAQVGNGEFAFGMDITGLQTFKQFYTSSQWSWHSMPLPEGYKIKDYQPQMVKAHGHLIPYEMPNPGQPEISEWLAGNPHRFHLGQIGFILIKADGQEAKINDLKHIRQHTDLWTGVVSSYFEIEGVAVKVKTACHGQKDVIGVEVESSLIKEGRLQIKYSFPYPNPDMFTTFTYKKPDAHTTEMQKLTKNSIVFKRTMDDAQYNVILNWSDHADVIKNKEHTYHLIPKSGSMLKFSTRFTQKRDDIEKVSADECYKSSIKLWKQYWQSGAAIDLSASTDSRWKELERRIILSQYVMRVNEAGSLPPQESGLVNNGWHGRFHFEMIWWHGVHYALWNRWELLDRYLHIYNDFLPTSIKRAKKQGYKGARWPKCTANFDREWPHVIHATLVWQQPHPIYFAELDYRLHPTDETLKKWEKIVFETADFMADFAVFQKEKERYVLGPPIYIVSENTNWETTTNPTFELSYWLFGLKTAQKWRERQKMAQIEKWNDIINKLSPLPIQDGVYVTHEGIEDMWTKFNYEHPALIGTLGMLPGEGVDPTTFRKTLDKVLETWNLENTWGWDFPMLAMAFARSGNPEKAIDMLLYPTDAFGFDEHGLSVGGPYPYFPANGGLLTAIAMMTAGWEGSQEDIPGFPKNGWIIKHEGFNKLP